MHRLLLLQRVQGTVIDRQKPPFRFRPLALDVFLISISGVFSLYPTMLTLLS